MTLSDQEIAKIHELASSYEQKMVQFAREMIAIPGESTQEKAVIGRAREEMERIGFDEVRVDPMGNLIGRIGDGERQIAIDAHLDTVGVGDPAEWRRDPYAGVVEDGILYGRGAGDQRGAMASIVYAGSIIRALGLADGYTLYVTGTVQEEECDGLCWHYILEEKVLEPEVVIVTEPTNLDLSRGQRGRMEIGVTTRGVSCHGSMPELGQNAIYKMVPILSGVETLNQRLKDDRFLGKGTICVTYIDCETPSLNAIPDRCYIHLDRRLTAGEDRELAVRQVKQLVEEAGAMAEVTVPTYERPSYTGLIYKMDKYYPTWVVAEDDPGLSAAIATYRQLFDAEPEIGRWRFSTNGVAIMGLHRVPCIGFGPGNEIYAHTVDDQVPVAHLVKAAAFYAAFPSIFTENSPRG
ncbi:MAG: YgeY family selenium metabolism-linked hydrolase [Candidatus Bipolaricaulia bacterium]